MEYLKKRCFAKLVKRRKKSYRWVIVLLKLVKVFKENKVVCSPTTCKSIQTEQGCCLPLQGSRTAATSKMERFVIIVNGWKRSILDVAAVLDPPLDSIH